MQNLLKLLIISFLPWLWPASWGWAQDMAAVAGHYYLEGVREVGSELLLHPDGRFHYFLAYGAYDEKAAGNWRLAGDHIILDSRGGYAPPRFSLKQSAMKPGQPLTVLVQDENGRGIAGIDVFVNYGGPKTESGYTQSYGWQAPRSHLPPKAIGLGVEMYKLQPTWFKVEGKSANYYVFTFNPGNLGKVLFHQTRLRWENGALIMERGGQRRRYVKGGIR